MIDLSKKTPEPQKDEAIKSFDSTPFVSRLLPVGSGKLDKRLVAGEDKTSYKVERIWDRTKEIIRLAGLGFSNVEIAKTLGISDQCVSYTRRSPLVRHQIDIIQAGRDEAAIDVFEQIKDMAPKALCLHDQVMDDDSIPLPMRQASAREVRSWMEFVLPKKTQQTNIGALLSLDDIREIRARAKASGQAQAEKPIEVSHEVIPSNE